MVNSVLNWRVFPAVISLILAMAGNPAVAQQAAGVASVDLERRLARLERLLESKTLVDMLRRLEALQREVQELRGDSEMRAHTLNNIKQRQRELYLDLDQRLQQLESREGTFAPTPATAPTMADSEAEAGVDLEPGGIDPARERAAYEQAIQWLGDSRYDDAVAVFQTLLKDFPQGRYAASAQYWIGEAYYRTERFDKALPEFTKLISDYSTSPKVPEALLKIGIMHYRAEQWDKAREVLEGVRKRYPTTTAASLAAKRLQQMQQEGR